jgi:hypothetical protein
MPARIIKRIKRIENGCQPKVVSGAFSLACLPNGQLTTWKLNQLLVFVSYYTYECFTDTLPLHPQSVRLDIPIQS